MASQPMPQPQGGPGQGGDASTVAASGPGSSPASSQQANQLQTFLGQLIKLLQQVGSQNEIIAPEIQQASQALVEAFKKTMQNSQPQQPAQAPPGQ